MSGAIEMAASTPESTSPSTPAKSNANLSTGLEQSQHCVRQKTSRVHKRHLTQNLTLLSLPDEILALVAEEIILDDERQADGCCDWMVCTEWTAFPSNSRSLAQTNSRLSDLVRSCYFEKVHVRTVRACEFEGGERNPMKERTILVEELVHGWDPKRLHEPAVPLPLSLRPRCELIRYLELSSDAAFKMARLNWMEGGCACCPKKAKPMHFPELREVKIQMSRRETNHHAWVDEAYLYNPFQYLLVHRKALDLTVRLLHDMVVSSPKLKRISVYRDIEAAKQVFLGETQLLRDLDKAVRTDATLESLALTFLKMRAKLPLRPDQLESIRAKAHARLRRYTGRY